MRELERNSSANTPVLPRLAIVGRGRLGNALAAALDGPDAALGPFGRGYDGEGADVVLLCVPDGEIAAAAAAIAPGPLVGHCSGASGLGPLAPHEAFSMHPLMTVTASGASFRGAGAAIAGSSPRALEAAATIAQALGLRPVQVADRDRAAYHAAASIASNFLVTIEGAAERVAATAGVDRELLVPLVRAAVDNWAALGPQRALTGPVARGDEATVAAQRDAISERTPELVELFDALVQATRELAAGSRERRDGPAGGAARMRTVRSIPELRAALATDRRAGATIGLVPTMGAFHEGHLSLIRRAREQSDVVVVSLFVNPTQFNESSDLASYPRDEQRDAALAAEAGVDYLFAPAPEEIYPDGFATTISVAGVTEQLEGAHRGHGHFDAVATVVAKLLNIVGPDVAYFGQKDAQQTLMIRRLARDLDIPVRIETCPTRREADGLAMSSRNVLLSPAERSRAADLHRALRAIHEAVATGERDPVATRALALAELTSPEIEVDYLELVSPDTLAPLQRLDGHVLAVVAARIGATRLIDNETININRGVATPKAAPTTA